MKLSFCALILALTCTLCSCTNQLYYFDVDTSDTSEEDNSIVDGWIPMEISKPQANTYTISGAYIPDFVETKNLVVYIDYDNNSLLTYVNKATGAVGILCGDPICTHVFVDTCPAFNMETAAESLCYVPENGRIYFIKHVQKYVSGVLKHYFYICSVGIDSMDLSQEVHYEFPEFSGGVLPIMKYSCGRLYFSEPYLNDAGKLVYAIKALDINTDKAWSIIEGNRVFGVRNGKLYSTFDKHEGFIEYDIDSGNKRPLNILPEGTEIVYNDRILVISKNTPEVYTCDIETLQIISSVSAPEMIPSGLQTTNSLAFTFSEDGSMYFRAFDAEYTHGNKLYKLKDGKTELYYEFDESFYISDITAISDRVFVRLTEVNKNQNSRCMMLYDSGDGIVEIDLLND